MKSPDRIRSRALCWLLMVPTLLLLGASVTATAQTSLTLAEVVERAQLQSIAARQVRTVLDTRYWEWRSFQASLRPRLLLQGNVPGFTRAFQPVTQPDGTLNFQPVTINNSDLSLALSQPIAATGGSLAVGVQVQRFDDFDRNNTLYSGQPFSLSYSQPLFAFNRLKWSKRIEPVRYQEGQQQYLQDREDIATLTTDLFFDLLLAQENLAMARTNLTNNDTLYKIALEREAVGQLSRNDLLQLQLGVLTARKDVASSRQALETAQLNLLAYVGLAAMPSRLELPAVAPAYRVDENQALSQARQNRPEVLGFTRRRLEAEQAVARARGETGVQANLEVSFGWTNRAGRLGDLYTGAQDFESIQLQFAVPIVDWGRATAVRETAKANQALTLATLDQDMVNFEQEIRTQTALYNMLSEQLQLSATADAIAQERYNIAKERFILGSLSITDLNLALQEKDAAKRDYIAALRALWLAHYQLRSLTLYDFATDQKIQ